MRAEPPEPLRARARVLDNRREGSSHLRLRLAVPGFGGFAPGQFVMVSPGPLSASRDPLLPRPMAIYRRLEGRGGEPVLEILYKVHGRGTLALAGARPDEVVGLVGPLGRGFPLPPDGAGAILVGGGTGIASLFELARRAAARGPVEVLLGAREAPELMGVADFEALDVALRVATEDGSRGRKGRVTELLPEALERLPAAAVHACGPTPMMRAAAELAAAAGRAARVSLENPMACGFGVCLGCAAPLREGGFALVCRDGPVLDAAAVDWERLA